MTIVNFTPWAGLIGGLLIGASASLLLWLNGRIAGISGIVAGATVEPGGVRAWRWLFLAGLLGSEYVTVGASPIGLSPSSSNCKSSRSTRGGTSGVGSRSLHGAGKAPPASEPSAALSPLTIGTGAVRRVARGSARCICI